MRVAASTILAGGTGTSRVCLTLLSHRQPGAIAPWTRRRLDALLSLLAFHLSTSTVAAELTFRSRITLQGTKKQNNQIHKLILQCSEGWRQGVTCKLLLAL